MKKVNDYKKTIHFQVYLYNNLEEQSEHEKEMIKQGFKKVCHSIKINEIRVNYSKEEK